MSKNFFIDTIMKLANCDETDAQELYRVIESQSLVDSWMNGTNRQFKIAISYARAYISNRYNWE